MAFSRSYSLRFPLRSITILLESSKSSKVTRSVPGASVVRIADSTAPSDGGSPSAKSILATLSLWTRIVGPERRLEEDRVPLRLDEPAFDDRAVFEVERFGSQKDRD